MAGAIPSHILVHVAVPLDYETAGAVEWVEGEPGVGPEAAQGRPFACVIFLPAPGGDQPNPYRPRAVRTPTLLCNPTRDILRAPAGPFPGVLADGTPIVLDREGELLVSAPELAPWTGAETARWQIEGVAQPFGRPGTVMGLMASISQVLD